MDLINKSKYSNSRGDTPTLGESNPNNKTIIGLDTAHSELSN